MKALIIGAGIGGLCTAIALQKIGVEVAIYEQATEPYATGAGLTLWANAIHALKTMGADDALDSASIGGMSSIYRWDGQPLSQMESSEFERRYGVASAAVNRVDFAHALRALVGENVQYGKRFRCYINHGDSIEAIFEDDTQATADLLIGADGIGSGVRQQMRPTSQPIYRGYPAWRGIVKYDHAHVQGKWGETWGRGARFGIVPQSRGRVYWFATQNRPANTPPEHHKTTLETIFGAWHHPIPDLIRATPDDAILYHDIADIAPLSHWVDGRAVLLGDAAHAMTPNMGQGACQAIEDAMILAQALKQHPTLADALDAYQAKR
ncbi:MAG: FAD-dependent monooxygenase, partial [Chloroflexota bacterium]